MLSDISRILVIADLGWSAISFGLSTMKSLIVYALVNNGYGLHGKKGHIAVLSVRSVNFFQFFHFPAARNAIIAIMEDNQHCTDFRSIIKIQICRIFAISHQVISAFQSGNIISIRIYFLQILNLVFLLLNVIGIYFQNSGCRWHWPAFFVTSSKSIFDIFRAIGKVRSFPQTHVSRGLIWPFHILIAVFGPSQPQLLSGYVCNWCFTLRNVKVLLSHWLPSGCFSKSSY